MNEKLLQYIWQFQYFNKNELQTVTGQPVQVIFPGNLNKNQGPDFLDARIIIGKHTWAGTVELHLATSHWQQHGHVSDRHYKNVVLHVVWQHDGNNLQPSIPVVELQPLVSNHLLERYQQWMQSAAFIPCAASIRSVKQLTWQAWMDRLLVERLQRKSMLVNDYLAASGNNWEEVFWWLLARNFGIKVNAVAFETIARSLPVKILAKHKNSIHQLEALLLGQAGMLTRNFEEQYPEMLRKEFNFLQQKYNLSKVHVPMLMLRMRPVNFPAIRLAQLAMLVHQSNHLFSKIKEAENMNIVIGYFNLQPNDYWLTHYKPGEASAYKEKPLGTGMIQNIIINTITPVLFAYGNYHRHQEYKDKALQWLQEASAENNAIIRGFKNLGIEIKSAAASQALIELKNEYCNIKRCLDCGVGNAIMKS